MMSLRNRLALSYALFICLAVLLLGLLINRIGGRLFAAFVQNNIKNQSEEIVRSVSDLYNPLNASFDTLTLEAMGMYFVHQGYIVSVYDRDGHIIWDARSCDMQECSQVLEQIAMRMEKGHRLSGGIQSIRYPLNYRGLQIGELLIDTYGPFFYSEGESAFLTGLNRFLLAAGIAFTLASIVLSIILAYGLSRPILKAAAAARSIAGGNLAVRIPDQYQIRELHELSRSVNDLASDLENGESWQKQLISDIAHELRTPLTCLQGNIEALMDGVWEPTPERLASCHEEVIRLSRLVDDLNTLSILEQENLVLKKTTFDLSKLLASAAEKFRPLADAKGIAINTDLNEFPVYADYDRLMQVFINLISNGVKYTDKGSVNISVIPPSGGSPGKAIISDTGIGIPPEALPRIFERFYRSDKSRNREASGNFVGFSGGAGIGLTIAKTIVNAHGGSISAASGENGSEFTVSL
jgi:signal transduction histidine kinase